MYLLRRLPQSLPPEGNQPGAGEKQPKG